MGCPKDSVPIVPRRTGGINVYPHAGLKEKGNLLMLKVMCG